MTQEVLHWILLVRWGALCPALKDRWCLRLAATTAAGETAQLLFMVDGEAWWKERVSGWSWGHVWTCLRQGGKCLHASCMEKNWLKEFSSDKCHKNTYAGICKGWNICSQQCFDHAVRLLKWYFHEISEILMAAGFLSVPFFSWSKKANFTGNITWLETHILMVSINQTMFY